MTFQRYDPSVWTEPPSVRIQAMIRFSHRWYEHWTGRGTYVGEGMPFAVVDEIAAIEGRDAWDVKQ